LSNTGGRLAFLISRRIKAKAMQRELRLNKIHKFGNRQRQAELQLAQFREQRAKENLMRVMLGYQRDRAAAERRYRLQFERMLMQREMLKRSCMKDIEVDERRRNNILFMQKANDKFKIDWIDNKWEFELMAMDRDGQLEEALRIETANNAKKRQRRVEYNRAMLRKNEIYLT
jgi:hypothetical protein